MSENAGAAPTQQTQVPPVHPVFNAPPTGAPGGPPIPTMIPLTQEEYQRLRGIEREHSELTAKQREAIEKAEADRIKAIADKDGAEAALKEQRASWETKLHESNQKYSSLEKTLFDADREKTIASVLSGVNFAGKTPEQKAKAAAHLRSILDPMFETSRDASGQIITREKSTGRPAAQVLKEAIASDDFAHFFASEARPGSGTDGTRPGATPDNPHKPGSLEDIAARFKAQQSQYGGVGFGRNTRR